MKYPMIYLEEDKAIEVRSEIIRTSLGYSTLKWVERKILHVI